MLCQVCRDISLPIIQSVVVPLHVEEQHASISGVTYSLTADIRMPDLRGELAEWRPERIVIRYLNIYVKCSTFVRCIRWSTELTMKMCKVILLICTF